MKNLSAAVNLLIAARKLANSAPDQPHRVRLPEILEWLKERGGPTKVETADIWETFAPANWTTRRMPDKMGNALALLADPTGIEAAEALMVEASSRMASILRVKRQTNCDWTFYLGKLQAERGGGDEIKSYLLDLARLNRNVWDSASPEVREALLSPAYGTLAGDQRCSELWPEIAEFLREVAPKLRAITPDGPAADPYAPLLHVRGLGYRPLDVSIESDANEGRNKIATCSVTLPGVASMESVQGVVADTIAEFCNICRSEGGMDYHSYQTYKRTPMARRPAAPPFTYQAFQNKHNDVQQSGDLGTLAIYSGPNKSNTKVSAYAVWSSTHGLQWFDSQGRSFDGDKHLLRVVSKLIQQLKHEVEL